MNQPSQTSEMQLDSLLNFRDVANSILVDNTKTKLNSGLLYRSARPDDTTVSDRTKLVEYYKIRTIIDLRTKTEHINALKKHSELSTLAQSAVLPVSNSATASPLKIEGIQYAEINLNGKGFERSLIWQLKYLSLAKLITLMALGYRMEAIGIIGREVLQQRGLIGLGIDTLEHSGHEIKEVFDVLSDENSWPVMVHCTQGKDRTGLIVLLILLLCGVSVQSITQDYAQSERELEPELEDRMKEISSIGLDESFAKCPSDFTSSIEAHLQDRYGGIAGYLSSIGVSKAQCELIRTILLQQA